MNKMSTFGMVALTVACGVGLCVTSAMAARDDFDRASLGRKWVVPAGDGALFINNGQLQGNSLSLGYHKNASTDSTVSSLIYLNGADLEYGAVASGDIANGNNAFVKLQEQNGSGMFEYGGFYVGNNSAVSFFQLDSPVPSPAILTVSFCGTVATMKINSFAGPQKYLFDYGTTFGTGGGLGTYGAISLDDFRAKHGGCAADGGTFAKGARVIRGSDARDLSLAK